MNRQSLPYAVSVSVILATTSHAQAGDARTAFLTGFCERRDSLDTRPVVEQPAQAPSIKSGMRLPAYPSELRRPGYEGTVVAAFVVEADGSVRTGSVAIMSSADTLLSLWACRTVPTLHLNPARDDGHPVPSQVTLPFTYRGPREASPADSSRPIVAAPDVRGQAQTAPLREWRLRVPVDSGDVRVAVTTRAASIEIVAPTGTFLLAFGNSSPFEEMARAAKALSARVAATDAADTLVLGPERFDMTEIAVSRAEGGAEAGYVLSGTNGAWGFRLPMSLAQSQALFGAMQGDSSFGAVSFPSIRKGKTPDGDIPDVSGAWLDFQLEHEVRAGPRPVQPRVPPGFALPAGGTDVKLWFIVDRTGRVPASSVRLIGFAPPLLARAARDALLSAEFRPAERNGSAVAEIVMQDFIFRPR